MVIERKFLEDSIIKYRISQISREAACKGGLLKGRHTEDSYAY